LPEIRTSKVYCLTKAKQQKKFYIPNAFITLYHWLSYAAAAPVRATVRTVLLRLHWRKRKTEETENVTKKKPHPTTIEGITLFNRQKKKPEPSPALPHFKRHKQL